MRRTTASCWARRNDDSSNSAAADPSAPTGGLRLPLGACAASRQRAIAATPDRDIVALLVAGDASIDAFDDAIDYVEDMLPGPHAEPKAEIHRLTARRHHPADVETATSSAL